MLESIEITMTRRQLYDMVWKEPLSQLSKKYKISDNGLRKVCRSMKVPFPRYGYWQMVKYGKKPVKTKFIEKFDGKLEHTFHLRDKDGKYVEVAESPFKLLLAEIENDDSLPLKVPDRLSSPDKLIIQARSIFEDEKKSYRYREGKIISSRNTGIDIRVAPKNIGRALHFMDTLIKLFRKRGHEVKVANNKSYIVLFGEEIEISILEKSRRITIQSSYSWTNTELQPTGILSFRLKRIYSLGEWSDGRELIEDKLASILAKTELLGKKLHEEMLVNREWHRQYQEGLRIKKEVKERVEKEIKNFKDLLEQSVRWRKTKDLREYIQAFVQDAENRGLKNDELSQWIIWANKKADWYDPFVKANDELLGLFDK